MRDRLSPHRVATNPTDTHGAEGTCSAQNSRLSMRHPTVEKIWQHIFAPWANLREQPQGFPVAIASRLSDCMIGTAKVRHVTPIEYASWLRSTLGHTCAQTVIGTIRVPQATRSSTIASATRAFDLPARRSGALLHNQLRRAKGGSHSSGFTIRYVPPSNVVVFGDMLPFTWPRVTRPRTTCGSPQQTATALITKSLL
jgi:hypothetical protein